MLGAPRRARLANTGRRGRERYDRPLARGGNADRMQSRSPLRPISGSADRLAQGRHRQNAPRRRSTSRSAATTPRRPCWNRWPGIFESMTKARAVAWGRSRSRPPHTAAGVWRWAALHVDLTGLDRRGRRDRPQQERNGERLDRAFIASKDKKLANASFVDRPPPDVVAAERRVLTEPHERLAAVEAALAALAAQKK